MRRILTALLLALPFLALGQDETLPKLTLELDKAEYAVGEAITGTATIEFAPGYHGYQNPPSIDWMIPVAVNGDKIAKVDYPDGILTTAAGTEALYYEHTTRIPVEFSSFASTGEHNLTVTFSYQQCNADLCFSPSSGTASATVMIQAAVTKAEAPKEVEQEPEEDVEEPAEEVEFDLNPAPKVTISSSNGTYGVGKDYDAIISIEFGEGLHAYQNPPTDPSWMIPVTVTGDSFVSAQYPVGEETTAAGTKAAYYLGTIEIPVIFKAPDTPGVSTIELIINYQQCDEISCYSPDQVLASFEIEVVEGDGTVPPADSPEADDEEKEQVVGFEGFIKNMLETENWLLIIPAALLIGLALCLTPCVFPMIPITVSFFSSQGSTGKGSRVMLGFMYALGIALTYGVVGGISARAGDAVGALFTKQWFVLALAALLIFLALSMFDLYEIRLPGFLSKQLKGRSGPVGALIMGLLMGFAAAPCAGALVTAVALQVAEIGNIAVGIGLFGAIGLGMGLPFMVLATLSAGSKGLPKSGSWLKTVKSILGFVVLAIAFGYILQAFAWQSHEPRSLYAWMAVYGGFAIYMFFFDKSEPTKAVQTIKGMAGIGLGVMIGMSFADLDAPAPPLVWHDYSVAALEEAAESGQPIMIDASANWCIKCREIEEDIFNTPEGYDLLENVYLLKIDWSTGVDQAYKDETIERFNIKGLPHLVFMKPGGEEEFDVQAIHDIEELKKLLNRAGAEL